MITTATWLAIGFFKHSQTAPDRASVLWIFFAGLGAMNLRSCSQKPLVPTQYRWHSTRIRLPLDESVSFTISVGIASTDSWDWTDSSTIDEMLHIADTNMYQAKKGGGSQAVLAARAAGE